MKNTPRSLAKYIRGQKSMIRKEVIDVQEQEKRISEMYAKLKKIHTPKEKKNTD